MNDARLGHLLLSISQQSTCCGHSRTSFRLFLTKRERLRHSLAKRKANHLAILGPIDLPSSLEVSHKIQHKVGRLQNENEASVVDFRCGRAVCVPRDCRLFVKQRWAYYWHRRCQEHGWRIWQRGTGDHRRSGGLRRIHRPGRRTRNGRRHESRCRRRLRSHRRGLLHRSHMHRGWSNLHWRWRWRHLHGRHNL